jgi:hypothetical protein
MARLEKLRIAGLLIFLPIVFTDCAGGGGLAGPPPQRTAATTARLTIDIPKKSASSVSRSPKYISAATQSITLNVTPQGSSTSVSGYPQTVNLTPTSAGCASTLASTQCTINLAVNPGSYDATVTTYDQTNGAGNALSAAQAVPFVVNAGVQNTVALTLGGIATSLSIVPDATAFPGGLAYGLVLAPSMSGAVSVFGVDADGNYILGAGAPTVTLTSSDSTVASVSAASSASPNRFTVKTVASGPAAAQLTASVTPVSGSGGSVLTASAYLSSTPPVILALAASGVMEFNADGSVIGLPSGSFPSTGIPTTMLTYGAGGIYETATFPGNNMYVYVFNTSGSETNSWPSTGMMYAAAAAYDSHNGWTYFAGTNTSNAAAVTAIDASGTTHTFSGGFAGFTAAYGITFDPLNDDLYLATTSGVLAYNENGTRQSTPAFAATNTIDVAYGAEHGWLYTINQGSSGTGSMVVYDANGVQQSPQVTGLVQPSHIVYNPGSGLLYILNLNQTLSVVTQDGVTLNTLSSTTAATLSVIP